jgi:Holliday junction resolvase
MKTYAKGVRWEREVKERLEAHGWRVFRCAASKPLDLIAFRIGSTPLWVECKARGRPAKWRIVSWEYEAKLNGARYVVARKYK